MHGHSLLNFDTGHVVVLGAAGVAASKMDNFIAQWIALATALYITAKFLKFLWRWISELRSKHQSVKTTTNEEIDE